MRDAMEAVLGGGLAGAAATAAMSGMMLAAGRAGLIRKQPPEEVTDAALDAVGADDIPESGRDALTVAGHIGYGVGGGVLYALAARRLRLPIAPALQGMLFGAAVWWVSYEGWVPALGIMPRPERDQPGRPESMLAAHLVYGAVLGAILGGRSGREPDGRPGHPIGS